MNNPYFTQQEELARLDGVMNDWVAQKFESAQQDLADFLRETNEAAEDENEDEADESSSYTSESHSCVELEDFAAQGQAASPLPGAPDPTRPRGGSQGRGGSFDLGTTSIDHFLSDLALTQQDMSQTSSSGVEGEVRNRRRSSDRRDEKEPASLLAADDDIEEAEEVDDRVGEALMAMNSSSDDINKLEPELEAARRWYLHVGAETERQCQEVSKGLKRNIKGAAMYYHKKSVAEKQQERARQAMKTFDEAYDTHIKAKEELGRIEAKAEREGKLTPKLMADMTDASNKVLEAQAIKDSAAVKHQLELDHAANLMITLDEEAQGFQVKRDIRKAKPYYDAKAKAEKLRSDALDRITHLENQLAQAKKIYAESMQLLNTISEEVHEDRSKRKAERQRLEGGGAAGSDDAGGYPSANEAQNAACDDGNAAASRGQVSTSGGDDGGDVVAAPDESGGCDDENGNEHYIRGAHGRQVSPDHENTAAGHQDGADMRPSSSSSSLVMVGDDATSNETMDDLGVDLSTDRRQADIMTSEFFEGALCSDDDDDDDGLIMNKLSKAAVEDVSQECDIHRKVQQNGSVVEQKLTSAA